MAWVAEAEVTGLFMNAQQADTFRSIHKKKIKE